MADKKLSLDQEKLIEAIKFLRKQSIVVTCPNCYKQHNLVELSPQMTCICNYVFDPREPK